MFVVLFILSCCFLFFFVGGGRGVGALGMDKGRAGG